MTYVRGHWRGGSYVRAHTRRGGASAGGAAVLGIAVIAAYYFVIKPWQYQRPTTVTVASVIDGDTIDITDAKGVDGRVRLLGINAPEQDQCGGADATAYLTQLLAGQTSIELARDDSQPELDRYGRMLAYVDLTDGTDVGLAIIQAGYATELTINKPHDRASAYTAADSAARANGLGAWATCPPW